MAALFTGGGTAIGRAICLALARKGCNVGVNFWRSEDRAKEVVALAEQERVSAMAIKADVSRDKHIRRMVSKLTRHFGRLDILVNNAGFSKRIPRRDMESMDEDTLDRILGVNIKGPFYCVRASTPYLLQSEAATIVNLSSDSAYHGDGSSLLYCAAKPALSNMTKAWARCLAPQVRVNAVAPGLVDTDFVQWESGVLKSAAARNPMGRITTVEDVARVVVFLASEASHITGQTVLVDGGETTLRPRVS